MARIPVEECTYIYIGTLQKSINRLIKRDHPNIPFEEKYKRVEEELKKFSVDDQTFEYTSINNYYGGYRWFFLCPRCKARSSKLFLPPSDRLDAEQRYLCKNCHKLVNECCVKHSNKMYSKVLKPLKRLKEIE